jgi:hypothetical protein
MGEWTFLGGLETEVSLHMSSHPDADDEQDFVSCFLSDGLDDKSETANMIGGDQDFPAPARE